MNDQLAHTHAHNTALMTSSSSLLLISICCAHGLRLTLASYPRRKEHERRTDLAHLPEPMLPRWRLGGPHGVSLMLAPRLDRDAVPSREECDGNKC